MEQKVRKYNPWCQHVKCIFWSLVDVTAPKNAIPSTKTVLALYSCQTSLTTEGACLAAYVFTTKLKGE